MKQHKWHKEIKAWADGAMIESRAFDVMINQWSSWSYEENPKWYDHKLFEYRIKPQPMFNGLTEEETNNTASVKGLSDWEKPIGLTIKPQPKEPQYLYVFKEPKSDSPGAKPNVFITTEKGLYFGNEAIAKIRLESIYENLHQ